MTFIYKDKYAFVKFCIVPLLSFSSILVYYLSVRNIVFFIILLSISAFTQVMFTDDFMRANADDGQWRVKSGKWALQSAWDNDPAGNANKFKTAIRATNPFCWVGTGNPGWCATGENNWDNYTLSASVRIEDSGSLGLICGIKNDENGFLARWNSVDAGNKMEFGNFNNGNFSLIASASDGLVPGRWYKITLKINQKWLSISIDDKQIGIFPGVYNGGIGLYCTTTAMFDDISAIGNEIDINEFKDREMLDTAARFRPRDGDMDAVSVDWVAPDNAGIRKYRHIVTGYGHFYTVIKPINNDAGSVKYYFDYPAKQADVIINSDLVKVWAGNKYHVVKIAKMKKDEEYTVKLIWKSKKLIVNIDDKNIATIAKDFSYWHQPAILYYGSFKDLDRVIYVSDRADDEYFDKSPVNWISVGNWEQTTRWACSPEWSFLGGWGRGTVALWNKSAFSGDQVFEVVAGIKMEYAGEMASYDDRYRGLAVTIMGDIMNEASGYTGIIGADAKDGTANRRTVLMRNGKIVAECDYIMPSRGAGHREWFNLRLQKTGNIISLWLDNVKLITYKDTNPMMSGIPGVWVKNNGIVVARARIDYTEKINCKLPQIAVVAPALPEWLNTGENKIKLKIYSSAKSAIKIISDVPAGENSPQISGDEIVFNFIKTGYHWYKIIASDGKQSSLSVDINLPVFDPKINIMKNPVISYKFNEAGGDVVKDTGIDPPCNMKIPNDTPRNWKKTIGLQLHGSLPVMISQGSANKLKVIAEKKAATIATWVSIDTVYPPPFPVWNSSVIAWETAQKRNFVLGFEVDRPIFSTSAGNISTSLPDAIITEMGIHPGLHLLVITWDGTQTSYYFDGELYNQRKITWHTDDWAGDAPLILGASANGKSPFLGRYYRIDIFDKCAGNDDVTKLYSAGPG